MRHVNHQPKSNSGSPRCPSVREVRGNGPGAIPAPRPGPTQRARVARRGPTQRARSAPRTVRRVIPREVARPGGHSDGRVRSAGRARCARETLTAAGLAAPPLHPAAHGGLPPCVTPGRCPSPAGRRHARRPRLTRERPSSRRSSLEPGQDHRQERSGVRPPRSHAMALRATLDCDLARHVIAPIDRMARTGGAA
jgi:hypothetical protein